MNKVYFILVLLAVFTQSCLAIEDISSNSKHHSLGYQLGLGSIRTDLASEEDGHLFFQGVTYGYQFSSNWTMSAGVVKGEEVLYCIITCFPEAEIPYRTIDFKSYMLSIKGSLPFSKRWSVYGKLGGNYFKSEFTGNNRYSVTKNGTGALLATGFDFRAYNGFGLSLEAIWLDMKEVNVSGFSVNVSYLF